MMMTTIRTSYLRVYYLIFYVALAFIFLRGKVLKWDGALFDLSLTSAKNPLIILFVAGLLLWVLTRQRLDLRFLIRPLGLLWMSALFLSVVFSQHLMESLKAIGVILFYVGFFILFQKSIITKEQVVKVLLLGSILSSFVCFANILYFCWSVGHSPVVPIIENFPFWPGKNMLGLFLVFNASMALGILLFFKQLNRRAILWTTFVLLIHLACLVITFSRGAWISMGVVFIVLAFMRPKVFVPLILFGLITFTLFSPSGLKSRMFSITNLKEANVQERLFIWQSALNMAKDHPVSGVGVGAFYKEYLQSYKLRGAKLDWAGEHAHNLYLHVFAEMGGMGLVALLLLLGILLKRGWLNVKSQSSSLLKGVTLGAFLALIAFIFYSLTDSTFNGKFSDASMFHVNLCLVVVIGLLLFKCPNSQS